MGHGTIRSDVQGVWGSTFHYEVVTEFKSLEDGDLEWKHTIYSIRDDVKTDKPMPEYLERDFATDAPRYNLEPDKSRSKDTMNAQHARIVRYFLG